MEKRKITCTCCPIGCQIAVVLEDGAVKSVSGNGCKRGAAYAKTECTTPVRTLTTTVKTDRGEMLSVKSLSALPKNKQKEAVEVLSHITVLTPVKIGQVIVKNILGTGVDIVATKHIGDGDSC